MKVSRRPCHRTESDARSSTARSHRQRANRLAAVTVAFFFIDVAQLAAGEAALVPFPADAGALNVKDFGAVGDGVHDDTAALLQALNQSSQREEHWHVRIVQVPAGTYRVSDTISKRFPDGSYNAGLVLIGAGQSLTTIRLADGAVGFQDPAHPKAVLYTTGKGFAQAPKGGYALRGEGNDGFSNFIENLTVDTGSRNPGAVGIDYLANNQGALRSVLVTGAGKTGIAMTRAWFGPALLDGVTVVGFDIGVNLASLNYSVTIDNLTLTGQRQIALRNEDNLVAAHGLMIRTQGNRAEVPLANLTESGEIVVDGGVIEVAGDTAMSNQGLAYVRDLRVSGTGSFLGSRVPASGVVDGVFEKLERISDAAPPWALKGAAEPVPVAEPVDRWVSVARFANGAERVGEEGIDATAAVKAAFASGAHTVYFPFGVYELHANIDVPPDSAPGRRHESRTIRWVPSGTDRGIDDPAKGLFRSHNASDGLLIEKLFFLSPRGHHAAVEHVGAGPLVLRDIVGMGVVFQRDAEAGPLYLTNVSGGFSVRVAGRAPVWGRQVDTEGGGARGGSVSVRIANDGSPMWLLGLKSEGDNTLVASSGGAVTDVVGVLFESLRGSTLPLFSTTDSRLQATGVEVAFKPDAVYTTILQETIGGAERTLMAESLPRRPKTTGVLVPRAITQQ